VAIQVAKSLITETLKKKLRLAQVAKSSEALIVGAGLAGLNAAIHCQAAGVAVTLLESSDRPDGRVTSDLSRKKFLY